MMEFCLDGNWMCARDGTWRSPGNFLRWTLAGRCGQMFGWKLEIDPGLGIKRVDWLEIFEWTLTEKSGQSFCQKFWTPPPAGVAR